MSQIDWSKPVYCRESEKQTYHFVGYKKDPNYVLVESGSGVVLTINAKSGLSKNWPLIQLENRLEPWERAWVNFYNQSDYDTCPYNYDKKEMFRLGYLEGAKK